ncbi:hypothetical protein [Streptomyces spectabilis]|uniref:Uncharacterized protein n=1 Tax=Streptomyces spectabilis TaxID=68270 RepID=A0A7W8B1M9_STRST|nr:hypothetical protein [Streptomyces spectabilis]MBB5107510.1 hypothetical protein [Streptomyces spectabilis]MCI3904823.1 hypothetical protein [Streptomyces spectabilis]GGV02369.1 hypothetical protein GCM10010245_06850 [Streptomyces spectabilis]
MQIADHFEELWSPSFGRPRGSVREFLASAAYPEQGDIARYLQAGHEIISVMGASPDVLGSGERIVGGDSLYTDGEWLWRGDLWFYVRSHYVRLPEEFLIRMRDCGYCMPDVQRPKLLGILDWVEERW